MLIFGRAGVFPLVKDKGWFGEGIQLQTIEALD